MRSVLVRGLSEHEPLVGVLRRWFDDVAISGIGDGLPALERFDAIVIASWSKLADDEAAAVITCCERGVRVLALAGDADDLPDVAGLTSAIGHGTGEWFLSPAQGSEATRRLASDIPVHGELTELVVGDPDKTHTLATVKVAMTDRVVVARSGHGRGALTTWALRPFGHVPEDVERLFVRCLGPQIASPSTDIGVGVIGYGPLGGMGHRHGHALELTDGLRFAAAVDTDISRLKAAEQVFPGIRTHRTVDELLMDDEVGAVIVATPPVSHTELTRAVLRSGRSVVTEKPLCFTVAEADELIALSRANDVSLTVHQNRRWDRDFRAIRRVMDEGRLGDVFNIETFVGSFEHPCGHWHSEVAISGGAVYDWGSHHLDWILQLMGDSPTTVRSNGHKRVWHDVTNVDQIRVHLDFADGREAEFFQSDMAAIRRPKFWIQGTKGTLSGHYEQREFERMVEPVGFVSEQAHHAEAPARLSLAEYHSDWGVTEAALPLAPDAGFAFHRNLADHLHVGEPLAVSPESARQVIAVLEAAQTSLLAGGSEVGVEDPV